MKIKPKAETGYTIVEVMVAIGILVTGLLMILPMLALNLKANLYSRIYGAANFLAQEKIEMVKSWPVYEQVDGSTVLYGKTDFWSETDIEVDGVGMSFSRTATVLHNGVTNSCDGVLYDTQEANDIDDEYLNTGGVVPQSPNIDNPCGTGDDDEFAGEDFKLVRVTVSWDDNFTSRQHTIQRFSYLAKF